MKKKICYILALFVLVLIPSKAFAVSGSAILSCNPSSGYPGDTITCHITADISDGTVDQFTGTVTLSDNLEFGSTTVTDPWSGTSNGGIFNLKSSSGEQDSFELASFTVKIKANSTTAGTVTLTPTKLGEVSNLSKVTQTISMATNVQDTAAEQTPGSAVNDPVKNPETGSNIPFMIIGGGLILVIVLYQVASKSKRISKI